MLGIRKITLEQYATIVLMREAPAMVGLVDAPFLNDNLLCGMCQTKDGDQFCYVIDIDRVSLDYLCEVEHVKAS